MGTCRPEANPGYMGPRACADRPSDQRCSNQCLTDRGRAPVACPVKVRRSSAAGSTGCTNQAPSPTLPRVGRRSKCCRGKGSNQPACAADPLTATEDCTFERHRCVAVRTDTRWRVAGGAVGRASASHEPATTKYVCELQRSGTGDGACRASGWRTSRHPRGDAPLAGRLPAAGHQSASRPSVSDMSKPR